MNQRIFVCAVAWTAVAAWNCAPAPPPAAPAPGPVLEGRAVLPVNTYAPGPPAGASQEPANGIAFPTPSQPVEGFSALLAGRHAGEYLGMLDNGFGNKGNSRDFLIRAYFIEPDFKTATGGAGTVAVKDFIAFCDPNRKIGVPIVNEQTSERCLTGGDIDPESMQRATNGDYWVGDEFGPWILHFDKTGALLDAPYSVPGHLLAAKIPGVLMSPDNPRVATGAETLARSRGFEAMAITPDGTRLIAALEGATIGDTSRARRVVLEFSIADRAFTSRTWWFRTEHDDHVVADLGALDASRFVAIERDGKDANAMFRSVYTIDLRRVDGEGFLAKTLAVDLTAIPDPGSVSLPPIHPGDVGIGNPFRVVCESIEGVLALDGERLLLGCDNNLPSKARNPNLADDSEFIIVKVPGLRAVSATLDEAMAGRFAALALACVQKEYPNKIAHVLNSPEDVKAPHDLTPSFYGCYDWHSAVHGHWLLARLARQYPSAAWAAKARAALATNITPKNIAGEVAYLNATGRETFERPYGLAWLLQLAAELREWKTPEGQRVTSAIAPLEAAVVTRLRQWIAKLAYPIREGEHPQTAFSFGLLLDWARVHDKSLEQLTRDRVLEFHRGDRNCPISYEPSGQDFLSPCLAEADLMRRVLPPAEFSTWLAGFLPGVPKDGSTTWLPIGVVTDKTDGKLAHLDGLNLSRAWMLERIAGALPAGDPRRASLLETARVHAASGLAAVTGEHYEGGHWLGSFATYLLTK